MEMVWCVVVEREGGVSGVTGGGDAALARGGAGLVGRAGVTTETRACGLADSRGSCGKGARGLKTALS